MIRIVLAALLALVCTVSPVDAQPAYPTRPIEVIVAYSPGGGAEWYILECDVPDSGSYTVPATVTGALPTGFGHCGAQLARIRRAETTDGRNIDLVVAHGDSWAWF